LIEFAANRHVSSQLFCLCIHTDMPLLARLIQLDWSLSVLAFRQAHDVVKRRRFTSRCHLHIMRARVYRVHVAQSRPCSPHITPTRLSKASVLQLYYNSLVKGLSQRKSRLAFVFPIFEAYFQRHSIHAINRCEAREAPFRKRAYSHPTEKPLSGHTRVNQPKARHACFLTVRMHPRRHGLG
jgi:hypothetical protein